MKIFKAALTLATIYFLFIPVNLWAQSDSESTSFDGELIYQFFITSLMALIAIYALYKLFSNTDPHSENAVIMKCPECGKEPFSVLKWSGTGIKFKDRMLGLVGCINCGTVLKRHHNKLMYLGLFAFSFGYAFSFIMLYMLSGPQFIDLAWLFSTVAILMIVAFFLMFYLFLFRTSFYKVEQ